MKQNNEKFENNLDYLKLKYIKENYLETITNASQKEISHKEFLEDIIQEEVDRKLERASKRRLSTAKLPCHKTLEQFQWSHPEKINQQQVKNLFHLNFIEKNKNIVFLGGCGVGKTHLAISLAMTACQNGYNVLFCSAVEIINNLSAARVLNQLGKDLKKYTKPDVLIIDELGYMPVDKYGADLLFQVITQRYERGSIILTSNRPFKKWNKIFNNDNIVTSAILDRILHHCEAVTIEGSSYRMKDRRK